VKQFRSDNQEAGKIEEIKFDGKGLVPAIVQEARTGSVLMLAYMDREAVRLTLETGKTWFWSRSRKSYWQKGETSGHVQVLKEAYYDCDADALLLKVEQQGVACHTGKYSCFFNLLTGEASQKGGFNQEQPAGFISQLAMVIRERKALMPHESYVARLLSKGNQAIARKVGEEALETVLAHTSESRERLVEESADLLFHLMLSVESRDIPFEEVLKELQKRHEE